MEIGSRGGYGEDLATRPVPEVGTILVAGATGYVGGRLVPELQAREYRVRVMVRRGSAEYADRWPDAEIVVADALDIESLKSALQGVHTAYYLIHPLLSVERKSASTDIQAAVNFREAAAVAQTSRIIYLGGLGDARNDPSPHLRDRARVAEELQRGTVPVTVLRVALIIGSGSAPFEVMDHLLRNASLLFLPRRATSRCQPISIRAVIQSLVGVMELPETAGRSFDIGGDEILTYEEMLKVLADAMSTTTRIVHSPVSFARFDAFLASLFTPVPAPIIRCLIDGMNEDMICRDAEIQSLLGIKFLSYRESVRRAMSREEQDNVHTRWSDSYPPAHELALRLGELKEEPRYTSVSSLLSGKREDALFESICRIGGDEGWFHTNWLWRLRGALDRVLSGVGTARGRRSSSALRINDVIDFWRVEDMVGNRVLLLRAEMKLPGLAWLEFTLSPVGDRNRLQVKAYFHTTSLAGRLYWYSLVPFHYIIFKDLIRGIEERSR